MNHAVKTGWAQCRLSRSIPMAAIALAALGSLTGCGSDPPPPDLTPDIASALIQQKWAQGELNHFKVVLHSDTLLGCGMHNDLWKLVDVPDRYGNPGLTMYQLTDRGHKVFTSAHLTDSGRGDELLLKGPYQIEIDNITDGAQDNTKNVDFRWSINWDKAPTDLKVCLPRFELSGNETAVFNVDPANKWRLVSYLRYLNPDEGGQQQALPLQMPQPQPAPQPTQPGTLQALDRVK